MEHVSQYHGGYKFELARVTVFLGANGSGKSTLLRQLKDENRSVYIEGGRTISIFDTVALTRQNFDQYRTLGQTLTRIRKKKQQQLVQRIFDAIMALIQRGQQIKDIHSDEVVAWEEGGRVGNAPKREQPPLDRLFEQYNEIFPNLHLSYSTEDSSLSVKDDRKDAVYGPSSLSDGEKQVFSILADMLELEDEFNVVVVDEPELNLHPELAERLWTLLETEYQNKFFIYATHNIQFALRSNVDALYVLSTVPTKIQRIDHLSEIPRSDLVKFLGGVPGILNATQVVVTEGHEKSFDSIFYRWILGDDKVEVFPCGSCNDVGQVISKAGLWSKISSDISLVGVYDLDFHAVGASTSLANDRLVGLALHEAESYICIPQVLVAAANAIGSQEQMPTEEDVNDEIFKQLEEQSLSIALRRRFPDATFTLRLSLEKSVINHVSSKEEAMNLIRQKSTSEIAKAVQAMDETIFEQRLDEELSRIEEIISNRDTLGALRFLPGKQLAASLAPKAGCKNAADLMRSIKKNLSVASFPAIAALKNSIAAGIAENASETSA